MMASISNKIKTFAEIATLSRQWKDGGATVVFTNGCFDLLHYGHLHYLAEAKALGDKLIVGLNSTASVRRLKGTNRPINDEATRKHLLAALTCVDAVVLFEQDTPFELITIVLPDLLVKGGDYKPEDIVGANIVLENGGEVRVLDFVEGYSTTASEQKMKKGK